MIREIEGEYIIQTGKTEFGKILRKKKNGESIKGTIAQELYSWTCKSVVVFEAEVLIKK